MEIHRSQQDYPCTSQEPDTYIAREDGSDSEEHRLIQRLKAGDEPAFNQLVEQYHTLLLGLARKYVRSYSSAEEVVQDTWIGVLQRLPFFEGRSSLKTWIFRILINRAQTCAMRDQRMILFSSFINHEEAPDTSSSELEPCAGGWQSLREDGKDLPETCLLSSETHTHIVSAIQALPASQRAVMILYDIEGRSPDEICTALGLSAVNQRVLLHRARTKVRQVLEKYRNIQ